MIDGDDKDKVTRLSQYEVRPLAYRTKCEGIGIFSFSCKRCIF